MARAGQSGTLRAVIFGVSDGLVSNTSLVMGVAGAASGDPKFILLAGIAGLLAGSFSMAVGEYISMTSAARAVRAPDRSSSARSSRRCPTRRRPSSPRIYRRKGFTPEEAKPVAHRLFADPEHALDTLVREELGLDPDELGNPWSAAFGSFLAFAAGAVVPVIPFVFGGGTVDHRREHRPEPSLAMFGVGGAVSLLTGEELRARRAAPGGDRDRRGRRDVRRRPPDRRVSRLEAAPALVGQEPCRSSGPAKCPEN